MDEHMSLGQWVLTLLICIIPCINIIMLLVWAFGNGGYVERKRFAQAQLIFCVICFVLGLLGGALFGAAFAGITNSLSSLIML